MVRASSVALALVALLLSPREASAQGWADKSGTIGVGASTTLGGATGLQLRTYLGSRFGLHGTVSIGFATITETAGDVEFNTTVFDLRVGAYASYKIASWRRGHVSGIIGADLILLTESTDTPSGPADANGVDAMAGLGLLGEVFPARYLSLHVELGLRLGLLGNLPSGDDRAPLPDNDEWDFSSTQLGLGADLLGAAGFTVWFD